MKPRAIPYKVLIILVATMPFCFVPPGTGQQPQKKRVDISGKDRARATVPVIQPALMPEFRNGKYTFEAARRELISQYHWERITSPPPSEVSTLPAGIISNQDPLPNTPLTPGVVVTLYISNGVAPVASPSPTPDVDLSVTATLAPRKRPYIAGEPVESRILVHNAGPSTATNVQINNAPTNLANPRLETPTGECIGWTCTIQSLDAGASATINVTATVVAAGNFQSVINVAALESDSKQDNNRFLLSAEANSATEQNVNSNNTNSSQNEPVIPHDPVFPPPWFWPLVLGLAGGGIVVLSGGTFFIWRRIRPIPSSPAAPNPPPVSSPPPHVPQPPSTPVVNANVDLKPGKSTIDGLQMTGPQIRLRTGLEMGGSVFDGPIPVIKREITNE